MSFLLTTLTNVDSNLSITNGVVGSPSIINMSTSLGGISTLTGPVGVPGTVSPTNVINQSLLLNNVIKGNATITTSNNTPTALLAIPIPSNQAVVVNTTSLARDTSTFLCAFVTSTASVKNNSGTVTSVGASLPSISLTADTLFTVAATWSIVGANLVLVVTGLLGETIHWTCDFDYFIA